MYEQNKMWLLHSMSFNWTDTLGLDLLSACLLWNLRGTLVDRKLT